MRRFLPFIILLVISLFYTRPFFHSGFFPTHDGEWAVVRQVEMFREIKDLQIPPRWSDFLNHGYGYPLFSFTYPFPYYFGLLFKILGFGFISSVKTVFVLSVILSAFFMYLLARELVNEKAGLLAAIFYIIAPFRLVNLYVRGSIGESISLALFPLIFYLSLKYVIKPTNRGLALTAVTVALLIISHNIMALIFFPLWIIFIFVAVKAYCEDIKYYTWRHITPLIILAVGLSAYFYLPALLEKQFIVLSRITLADKSTNFINLRDYLVSPWNYGLKPSVQLGWAHILTALTGLISIFFWQPVSKKKFLPYYLFIFISIALIIMLAHPLSAPFWNVQPLASIDFPWRLSTVLVFLLALSSVFLVELRITSNIVIILAVITLLLSSRFAKPSEYINRSDSYYYTNDATTTSKDELMPVWVVNKPTERYKEKVEVIEGEALISDLSNNSRQINFIIDTAGDSRIRINTLYFPGWEYYSNGNKIPVEVDKNNGTILVYNQQPGRYAITGRFEETQLRKTANMISLASVFITLLLLSSELVTTIKKHVL